MSWMSVWTRAVIAPAFRRAAAVWLGVALGAAIIGGGNGIYPQDITRLALHAPVVGAVLAATWILLFVPTARLLVRQPQARYLRALPGPRALPAIVAVIAMIGLQLPWLALWIAGDGARGVGIVIALTLPIAAIAAWPVRPPRSRAPRWRSLIGALVAIYARALWRRAAHTLVRGVGLAVVAGLVGGLVARNNALAGASAASIASATVAIVLVPGWAGALLPLVDAHRTSAWLARSLGASERERIAVLAICVTSIYAAGAAIAAIAAAFVAEPTPYLALVAGTGAGTGLVATRALVWAERASERTTPRAVVGAVLASAAAVLAIGLLGPAGVAAIAAFGVLAIATVKP